MIIVLAQVCSFVLLPERVLILMFFLVRTCLSVASKAVALADLASRKQWIVSDIKLTVFLTGGPEGLRSLTNPKAIVVDRWPFLFQTSIPAALDYPIRSLVHSW